MRFLVQVYGIGEHNIVSVLKQFVYKYIHIDVKATDSRNAMHKLKERCDFKYTHCRKPIFPIDDHDLWIVCFNANEPKNIHARLRCRMVLCKVSEYAC